ncbi:MAG: hypothetical protein HOJ16_08915 [Candidatus Peribacter sp.]|jgi:hypothetical protein|nr:hypothetical protein [Candidatus Jacksonbacteria bacterium]MBT5638665.1 hypothetical protein [Candidatus Peribacter sp.]MBT6034467.1 hypothetical protein [Candidatus Jacksonbacteria bacterium]MBT6757736.1 hypothetical protein [Candidatus Jacksonbacteria bacterium]MBT6955542.1 hypothetical protein [Candidatus Jacksonbacteria bacterium]
MSKPVVLITGVNPNRPDGNIAYNTFPHFLWEDRATVITHCLREEDAQLVQRKYEDVGLTVWGNLADPVVVESISSQMSDWLDGRKLSGWVHTPGPFPEDPTAELTDEISVEMQRGNVETFTVPFNSFSSLNIFAFQARIVTFSVSTADDMVQRSGAIRAYGAAKKGLEKACADLQQSNADLFITTLALGVVEGSEHTPPGFEEKYLVPMGELARFLMLWILLEDWHATGVYVLDRGWSGHNIIR